MYDFKIHQKYNIVGAYHMPGTMLGSGSKEWSLCLQILPTFLLGQGWIQKSVTTEYTKCNDRATVITFQKWEFHVHIHECKERLILPLTEVGSNTKQGTYVWLWIYQTITSQYLLTFLCQVLQNLHRANSTLSRSQTYQITGCLLHFFCWPLLKTGEDILGPLIGRRGQLCENFFFFFGLFEFSLGSRVRTDTPPLSSQSKVNIQITC